MNEGERAAEVRGHGARQRRVWQILAGVLAMTTALFLVLWLLERPAAEPSAPSGDEAAAVAERNAKVAPDAATRSRNDSDNEPRASRDRWDEDRDRDRRRRVPHRRSPRGGGPYGFDWDPFGDDFDSLFDWPQGRGKLPPDVEQFRRQLRDDMDRMRDDLHDMRRQFRDRLHAPPSARRAPQVTPRPLPGVRPPAARGEDREKDEEPRNTRVSGVELSRLELPDAVVLIVRAADIVEGTLNVKVAERRVTVNGKRRAPDGVESDFSNSVDLDGAVDAARVEVHRVEGGYRVLLPLER